MQRTKSIFLQLVCLMFCLSSIELHAQGGATVTVDFDDVTVLEVLKSVEKETSLAFFYNNADVDVSSIELFVDGGRVAMTDIVFPTQPYSQFSIECLSGESLMEGLRLYELK